MFKLTITLILSLIFISVGNCEGSIRQQVESLLPNELVLLTSKSIRADLEKKLSAKIIKKNDSNALYLHYFDDKNDVTIGFKKNRFDYLYVEMPKHLIEKKQNFYQEVLSQLSSVQKDKIAKDNIALKSHESGRYIQMDIPEEKMILEFYNNEKKELRSVILYSKK